MEIEKNENNTAVLVFELAQANLTDIIKFRKEMNIPWNVIDLFNIMKSLLESLEDVKDSGLSHRNIKAANIVYCLEEKCFKLCDFSKGKLFDFAINSGLMRHSIVGTGHYQSPEVLRTEYLGETLFAYNPHWNDLHGMVTNNY